MRKKTTMEKMLVVDDEVQVLDVLREFLTANGYEIHTATSGAEALEKMKLVKPSVVLLDVIMPGMGGIETLKEIRKIDSDVGVIMATAVADDEIAKKTFHLGAYDYITKPFDLNYLETVVMVKLAEMTK